MQAVFTGDIGHVCLSNRFWSFEAHPGRLLDQISQKRGDRPPLIKRPCMCVINYRERLVSETTYSTIHCADLLALSLIVTGIDVHHLSWWTSSMRPWTSSTLPRYRHTCRYCSVDIALVPVRLLHCTASPASWSYRSQVPVAVAIVHCSACIVAVRRNCNHRSWLVAIIHHCHCHVQQWYVLQLIFTLPNTVVWQFCSSVLNCLKWLT